MNDSNLDSSSTLLPLTIHCTPTTTTTTNNTTNANRNNNNRNNRNNTTMDDHSLERKTNRRFGRPWKSVKKRWIGNTNRTASSSSPREEEEQNNTMSSLRQFVTSPMRNHHGPPILSDSRTLSGSNNNDGSSRMDATGATTTTMTPAAIAITEWYLRHLLFLLLALVIGAHLPTIMVAILTRLLEYTLVAYTTCWALSKLLQLQQPSSFSTNNTTIHERTPLLESPASTTAHTTNKNEQELPNVSATNNSSFDNNNDDKNIVHPSLEPYHVIDVHRNERIYPNSRPFPIQTDYFTGQMMILIRTPPDNNTSQHYPANAATMQYLQPKARRFEFQFQVQLLKLPSNRVYFACELHSTRLKLGMIQKAFVNAAMAFVKQTNPNFHYNLSGSHSTSGDGAWEPPHMAFPVEEGMNRVVVSPPGSVLPTLGEEIVEDPASIQQRKKGRADPILWNLQDTYTFSLWSAYVDFLEWKVLNLPGIRPFSLTNVIGEQPILLTLYELASDTNDTNNDTSHANVHSIAKFEMCNLERAGMGPATARWRQTYNNHHRPANGTAVVDPGDDSSLEENLVDDCDDDDDEEEEVVNKEMSVISEGAAEDLGEGIYVQSGDSILLREVEDDRSGIFYVANGGGFAILQEQSSSSSIVIEKAGKSRIRKNNRSKLIKSGDTVIFKLMGKEEVKYLSIHRGWWLKWVSTVPTKNGFFTIHTHETEFDDPRFASGETQSAYLRLGSSFWLQHKRWSKYHVGIARDASATYGGRMLGLHIPDDTLETSAMSLNYNSDDNMEDGRPIDEGGKRAWMRQLQLQAYDGGVPTSILSKSSGDIPGLAADEPLTTGGGFKLVFSNEQHRMDVPAWIEIMDRQQRVRQHAYVVRVRLPSSDSNEQGAEREEPPGAFIRLRTGRDLAQVLRVGVKWRNSFSTKARGSSRNTTNPDSAPPTPIHRLPSSPINSPSRNRSFSTPTGAAMLQTQMGLSTHSFDTSVDSKREDGFESSDAEWEVDSEDDEVETLGSFDELADTANVSSSKKQRKGRKLIGKIARTTGNAGKKVVTQSVKGTVNAGKATVSAGKAILPIRSKKPPAKEPKSGNKRHRRRQIKRDLRVDVNSRSIKDMDALPVGTAIGTHSSAVLAGELSAPEQSCRTASVMLATMSSQPESSVMSERFSPLLSSLIESALDRDTTFLRGGAVQLGITPAKYDFENGSLLYESITARCLWESHWREEWCGIYEKSIVFFAPLSSVSSLELSVFDIQHVRFLDPGASSPLAGYPILVFETAWLCHYCAFADSQTRQDLFDKVHSVRHGSGTSVSSVREESSEASSLHSELSEARFWQGFQTYIDASRMIGGGKWANVASGSKAKGRTVLNGRRMGFDLVPLLQQNENIFVEELLSTALSFSSDLLKQNPEALIQFLDWTSHLQTLRLDVVNLQSREAFCLMVNLFHCLLQHALLFSVNGPLHKKSFVHFMRTSCYEIGGDVFSLSELYACVIRGNMTRPSTSKSSLIVDAPKKSGSYRFYALGYTSPWTSMILNTADMSFPMAIPVLNRAEMDEQIQRHAASFCRHNVVVDFEKKLVVLPRTLDLYRSDFVDSGSGVDCLRFIAKFLDPESTQKITTWLEDDPNSVAVKFHPQGDQFHTHITRDMDTAALKIDF